jgi:hypothetical protein
VSEPSGGPAASFQHIVLLDPVSLVQWVNGLLPAQGDNASRPGDAPTLTMEPGSPANDVFPHICYKLVLYIYKYSKQPLTL